MRGSVTARLEAKLRLTIIGPTGSRQDVDAVIDTGFTGFLVLPAKTVAALNSEGYDAWGKTFWIP